VNNGVLDQSVVDPPRSQATFVTMAPQQQMNACWRVESAQVLMWALGFIPRLPPYDAQANHDLLKQIPSGDMAGFASSAHLRKESEINRAQDDAELCHWRSRTRQLIEEGREFPADNFPYRRSNSLELRSHGV
jgi:hypothetical protein